MCVYRNGRRKVYTRVCARVREKTKGRRGGGGKYVHVHKEPSNPALRLVHFREECGTNKCAL